MSTFVRNLTIALIASAVATGIFVESFLSFVGVQIPSTTELRWSLLLGMPIILFLSYIRFNRQPAETPLTVVVQSIGLLALFIAPYGWAMRHAQ